MKKISVIIACFNAAQWVGQCYESLKNQTMDMDDLELIFVDDSSTDEGKTWNALMEIESDSPDSVMLIRLEENMRQGGARNVAMQYMSGKYMMFLDADDIYRPETCQELYDLAEQNDADIIQFDHEIVWRDMDDVTIPERTTEGYQCFFHFDDNPDERRAFLIGAAGGFGCTNKIYRTELIRTAGVRFAEHRVYEEPRFVYPLFLYARNFMLIETKYYIYRKHMDSTMTSELGVKLYDHPEVQLELWNDLVCVGLVNGEFHREIEYHFLYSYFMETICFSVINNGSLSLEYFSSMQKKCMELCPDFISNPYVMGNEGLIHALSYIRHRFTDETEFKNYAFNVVSKTEYKSFIRKHLAIELVEGVDNNDFENPDDIPMKYTWAHMAAFYENINSFVYGPEKYKTLYALFLQAGVSRVKRKVLAGEKIEVVFISYSATQWPAEGVYNKLLQDSRFSVKVLIVPLTDRDSESAILAYKDTYEWFLGHGYQVIGGLDVENKFCRSWDDLRISPDILIHLSPWYESYYEGLWYEKLPVTCLNAYIPYGFYMANNRKNAFTRDFVYNTKFTNAMWRIYCDSSDSLEGYRQERVIEDMNVKFSGYVKMDFFYKQHEYSEDQLRRLWKIPEEHDVSQYKKVIVAPHYSISENSLIQFSTFHQNYMFLLRLAKQFSKEASFIFKPHPNLRMNAVSEGLFNSSEEYDAYITEWNKLPNAKVALEESYMEIFETSDAMIMDSSSFIGEYAYTGKPLLFLTRPEQEFSSLGMKMIEAYYRAPGDDYEGIERFMREIVLGGQDSMKAVRRRTFKDNLDYYCKNNRYSEDFIVEDICRLL